MRTFLGFIGLIGLSVAAHGQNSGVLGGGGPLFPTPHAECISPEQRAEVAAEIRAFEAAEVSPYHPRGPVAYTFYPMAGNWYRDATMVNFVDLDPGAGLRDWDCTDYVYDGHNGHDYGIRGFGEQDVGVPIFAALPGTVVATRDGEPDRNTVWMNVPANYVVLRHAGNHYTYYWHMKRWSVAVSVGQVVRAGEQIGQVGSSGISSGPHLHFETGLNGAVYEPFAGACRSGPSGFTNQYAIDRTFRITEFGITPTDLSTVPPPPEMMPRTGHLAFAERPHWFWLFANALPANSTWRVRYIRPNGSQAFDSGTGTFGGNPFYRTSWWYWYFTINDMGTTAGTWRIRLDINGATVVDAPVEVRPTRDPAFNRPPAALAGLRFDPPSPDPADVVFCRIDTSLLYDDPDYDIVRYTYVWTLDGVEVRRVTSAAHADAIPANSAAPGDTLRCVVTPTDARGAAAASSFITYSFPACPADFNRDGGVDGGDVEAFYLAWEVADPGADVNQDGGVDGADVETFFIAWEAGGC